MIRDLDGLPLSRLQTATPQSRLGWPPWRIALPVLVAAVISVATAPAFAAPPAKHLNVLWICADDHAPYVLGAYGNRRAKTPNLDRLAAGGMRFDRAFCNSPVCTASRQSFITGRYPRTLGVTQLGTPLPAGDVTLAHLLKQAGYETAAFGKMHFNSRLTHGFEKRLDLEDFAAVLKSPRCDKDFGRRGGAAAVASL